MPDLEERIAAWRRRLAEALGGRGEVIEELEGHLREEVQRLVGAGRPEAEAFELAAARLGSPEALAAEFARAEASGPAWLPVRVVRALLLGLAGWVVGYLTATLSAGRMDALLAVHVGAVTLGYATTFLVGFLGACYLLARPFTALGPGQALSLRRAAQVLTGAALALTAAGVVLGAFWARDHLGRFWGWDAKEVGGLAVLAWNGLLLGCLLRRVGGPAGMLLAVAGNVVVSLGWFGAGLLAGQSPPGATFWLGAFVVLQLLILGAGLVPAGRWARQAQ